MTESTFLTVAIEEEVDLVVVRQRSRRLAELLGFEIHDQTRIATAASEIARAAAQRHGPALVTFGLGMLDGSQTLRVRLSSQAATLPVEGAVGAPAEGVELGDGIGRARRLMDGFAHDQSAGRSTITLEKRIPKNKTPVGAEAAAWIRQALAREAVGDPLSEVRAQNQELLRGLDEVKEKQDELVRLNEELENTNRGVVALYAELDQKSIELQSLNHTLEERIAAAIEERERAQAALRQSQKMDALGQLTGGIAHDFNNLLQSIGGNLEIIGRNLPRDAARLQRAIAQATRGVQNAANLTRRLLAFSRRQPLAPKPVDVNELVVNMSDMLRRTLGEMVTIRTGLVDSPWVIEVDPNELENALLNLAVNARDAMPDGGTLTIETANVTVAGEDPDGRSGNASRQCLAISVRDSGVGMSPGIIGRAFEPFFTTKDVGKGTGLGLAMVYGFARQSGGDAKIESKQGEGTVVTLYFPRWLGAAPAAETTPAAPPASARGSETILVVEDDPDVRTYSVEALSELGYRVLAAEDGPSALRLIDSPQALDLLFTDVVLPNGLTGRQLAQSATAVKPGLKVLFTSGYARNALEHNGRLDADVQMIGKPFTFAELAKRVREVLGPPV